MLITHEHFRLLWMLSWAPRVKFRINHLEISEKQQFFATYCVSPAYWLSENLKDTFLLAVKRISSNIWLTASRNSAKRGLVLTNTCRNRIKSFISNRLYSKLNLSGNHALFRFDLVLLVLEHNRKGEVGASGKLRWVQVFGRESLCWTFPF